MGKLPRFYDERLLVGIETSDDAAIYKITDEIALIQTVDFFTPVVDDPYTFGQIAAANALSDVYAMGGVPKIALNIVGFPNCLDPSVLGEILAGGADKVKEAGAVLVGGHSIQDDEPKYGLCVSGFVHPDKIYKNFGCQPGDVLILTKQIGSGIINTAVKAEMASDAAVKEVTAVMTALNKKAKEVLDGYPVHACTDITGFGLLGHCMEPRFPMPEWDWFPPGHTETGDMPMEKWTTAVWKNISPTCFSTLRPPAVFCSALNHNIWKQLWSLSKGSNWVRKYLSSERWRKKATG